MAGTVGIDESKVHTALRNFNTKAKEVVTKLPQDIQRDVFGELNEGWVTVHGKQKQTEYINQLNQAFDKAARNFNKVLKKIDNAAKNVGTIDPKDPYTSLSFTLSKTPLKTDGVKSELGGMHYLDVDKIKKAITALDSILGTNGRIETYKDELRQICRDSGLYSHDKSLENTVSSTIAEATKDVRNKLEEIKSRIIRLLTSTTETALEAKRNSQRAATWTGQQE